MPGIVVRRRRATAPAAAAPVDWLLRIPLASDVALCVCEGRGWDGMEGVRTDRYCRSDRSKAPYPALLGLHVVLWIRCVRGLEDGRRG